ncbi:MAG: hypothetical protein J6X14_01180, partial [Lachnospiraceae bacterium]|nr:hypothetical protein [Lachnospiraceae bacterium]
DVFASLAISSVIVFGINVLADRVEFTHKMRLILACVFVLLAIGTAIYTYVLYASGTIVYKDAADSFKGCGGGLAFAICWVLETRFVNFDVKCDKLWKQVLKVVIGMGVLLLLKEGLKFTFNSLFGQNFINEIVRYFLLLSWAMLGMPMIIKKFFASESLYSILFRVLCDYHCKKKSSLAGGPKSFISFTYLSEIFFRSFSANASASTL